VDSVIRAAAVYAVLLLMFRLTGKRSLGQITTFDAVLLLIISEAVQQALIGRDNSMVNAFLLVLTLLSLEVVLSVLNVRSRRADKILNDVPLLVVAEGAVLQDRLARERISEDDILERARMLWGIERMDEVRFAVLERNGDISIVPRDRPRARSRPSAAGAAEG
jgi:uncharacterized membrane protein YcaP (DUF421 family)